MIEQTEEQMRLRVASDYRKYMNPERKARLEALLAIPRMELSPQQGDELQGIAWMATNLLTMMDAQTIDNAFTPEGVLFHVLMKVKAELMKNKVWRGGEEDQSEVTRIIAP
jgi:hypothetical protein